MISVLWLRLNFLGLRIQLLHFTISLGDPTIPRFQIWEAASESFRFLWIAFSISKLGPVPDTKPGPPGLTMNEKRKHTPQLWEKTRNFSTKTNFVAERFWAIGFVFNKTAVKNQFTVNLFLLFEINNRRQKATLRMRFCLIKLQRTADGVTLTFRKFLPRQWRAFQKKRGQAAEKLLNFLRGFYSTHLNSVARWVA